MSSPENYVLTRQTLATIPGRERLGGVVNPMRQQTFTNLAASDDDAIKTSIASSTSTVTYFRRGIERRDRLGAISPPRNI